MIFFYQGDIPGQAFPSAEPRPTEPAHPTRVPGHPTRVTVHPTRVTDHRTHVTGHRTDYGGLRGKHGFHPLLVHVHWSGVFLEEKNHFYYSNEKNIHRVSHDCLTGFLTGFSQNALKNAQSWQIPFIFPLILYLVQKYLKV